MKHDWGESEYKHLCITDTLKNAWPFKCHNSTKHFFFILVLLNFKDKLNFAFVALRKSGSATLLGSELSPWWACFWDLRISPSLPFPLYPSFSPSLLLSLPPSLPPSFPFFLPPSPSLLPSLPPSFLPPFLWQIARAVGITDVRQPWAEVAKSTSRAAAPPPLPVPPGPVTEWGSGSARSRKPRELILFWAM